MAFEYPLAALELKRIARSPFASRLRLYPPVIAGVFAGLAWFFASIAGVSGEETASLCSSVFISLAMVGQTVVVAVFSPVYGAGLFARERQERTIDLLLLADMRASNLYFAKFVSVFAASETLLLASLPILAIASALGGITLQTILLSLLGFSAINFVVITFTLLFSALSHRPMDALVRTEAVVALGLVLMATLPQILFFMPRGNFTTFSWAATWGSPVAFVAVAGTAFCAMIGAVNIAITLLLLRYLAGRGFTPSVKKARRPFRLRFRRRRSSSRITPGKRFYSAIADSAAGTWIAFPRVLVVIVVAVAAVISCNILYVFLPALIFYDIVTAYRFGRQSGALDDLILTGYPARDLARDICTVHFRRTFTYGFLTSLPTMAGWSFLVIGFRTEFVGVSPVLIFIYIVLLIPAIVAKQVFACTLGCSAANELYGSTFRRVVLCLFMFWGLGILVFMTCGVFLVCIALIGENELLSAWVHRWLPWSVLTLPVITAVAYVVAARSQLKLFEGRLRRGL